MPFSLFPGIQLDSLSGWVCYVLSYLTPAMTMIAGWPCNASRNQLAGTRPCHEPQTTLQQVKRSASTLRQPHGYKIGDALVLWSHLQNGNGLIDRMRRLL